MGQSQNLVQNPGFEALTQWDSLWILSFTDPSSRWAEAASNTTEFHGGVRSLELSNNNFNRWTYFYTDSINAPISFSANKSYEVSGWLKILEQGRGASVSIFWNGSQDGKVIYSANPDPVTNPDWFRVKDTITPVADFGDGYLSLGMRAGKDPPETTGRVLFDDLSVVRIPDNTETEILDFAIPQQTGPAVIDCNTHTIRVEVEAGTDVTALTPDLIALSRGATVDPDTGVSMDFTNPVTYTVTAQDELIVQKWVVIVVLAPASETDILAFSFPEQTGPATIDTVNHEVHIEVKYGADLTALVPTIRVSDGATIDHLDRATADYTSTVTYTVIAEDGITVQEWTVYVSVAAPGTGTGITAFSFKGLDVTATIDSAAHSVSVEVPYGTAVDALIPVIEVSPGASVDPQSGETNDFTNPVVYTVTAEDGTTVQEWTVNVVMLPNTETGITAFSFEGLDGTANIDGESHEVTFEVPYGTAVDALIPVIEVSPGASVDPAGGETNDFTNPVVYTVTAEDGTTVQEWTVNVVMLPNTETEILSFSFAEQTGPATIDSEKSTITVEVEKETDLTALVPAIELSPGATMDPPGGVAADFSSDVVYTVTAEDGVTTQDWTVSVTLDPAVSVPENHAASLFNVYPNPAHDLLVVDVFVRGDIIIKDILGRTVVSVDHASGKTMIWLTGLEQGIYFVRMEHAERDQISRVIVR